MKWLQIHVLQAEGKIKKKNQKEKQSGEGQNNIVKGQQKVEYKSMEQQQQVKKDDWKKQEVSK